MRNIIIALIVVLLLLIAGFVVYNFVDFSDDEPPAPQFTPPPLSDNPPMSGDAIDSIAEEMKRENK